jgi:hypothetical protein
MKERMGKNKLFLFGFSLIGLLSVILRFYNYSLRFTLWVDQASFALLSRYALFNHKLPLLGPFSSAGPFQTGGEWYWLMMFFQSVYPWSLIAPWVGMTALGVAFVIAIMLLAEELAGKKFALIVGLLTAVSAGQVSQGINLSNQSPLPLISLFALWAGIRFLKEKKLSYLFTLSLLAGLAPAIHAQGFMLIPLVLIVLIFSGISFKKLALVVFGLFLPWLPIFIADSNNHFSNTYHLFSYYLRDQYKISLDVLGRRWLTYLGVFWPEAWANIIGGNIILGYLVPFFLIILGARSVYSKSFSKVSSFIILSFLAMIIMVRYARVPLYDSNLLLIHPFIFLLTGWLVLRCFKINRILGALLLLIIVILNLNTDIKIILNENNNSVLAQNNRAFLIKRFPKTKFAIYDFKFKTPGVSQPLTLYLDEKNKIDDNGKKIGISIATFSAKLKLPVIYARKGSYYIYDLDSLNQNQLSGVGFESVDPSAIYRNVQEWYKYKK